MDMDRALENLWLVWHAVDLHSRWKCLRYFLQMRLGMPLERPQGTSFIDMDYGIELIRQRGIEIMTEAFGFRPVYNPDRSL